MQRILKHIEAVDLVAMNLQSYRAGSARHGLHVPELGIWATQLEDRVKDLRAEFVLIHKELEELRDAPRNEGTEEAARGERKDR